MAGKKNNRSTGAKDSKCDKCGATAHAIPNKQHRRCSGQPEQAPRHKHENLPGADRGRWQ